jgi:pilus assembly protein Flp/PilA
MQKLINLFRRDERGAAMVEYGLLVGLIALVAAVGATTLGTEVSALFSSIATTLKGLVGGGG